MLLQTPGIKLFDFTQAEAYTRRFPFLSHVVLPRGIVDLGRDLPPKNYHLIAPTATLVARDKIHPGLIDLFVQAAATIHGGAGWFSKKGEFPSPSYTEIPVASDAEKFYKEMRKQLLADAGKSGISNRGSGISDSGSPSP